MILISMTSLVCVLLNIHHKLLVVAKYTAYLVSTQALPLTLFQVCVPSDTERSQTDSTEGAKLTCWFQCGIIHVWLKLSPLLSGDTEGQPTSLTLPRSALSINQDVSYFGAQSKLKAKSIWSFPSKCYFRPAMSSMSLAQTVCGKYFRVCMKPHRNKHVAFQEKCVKLIFRFSHTVNVTTTIMKHVVKCTYWCLSVFWL